VLPFALAIASISGLTSYFAGDKIVLGMSQAHEVSEQQEPQLHHVVEELVIGAGIPKPKIYVIEDSAPNAFATGRDPKHSSVAVTRGLLTKLDRTELQGVLAHELSHVRNFDIRLMLIVAVLLGMAALLSDWIFRSMFSGGGGCRPAGAGPARHHAPAPRPAAVPRWPLRAPPADPGADQAPGGDVRSLTRPTPLSRDGRRDRSASGR